ncbi:hypothetical protein BATDEDRAFT_89361 [Batrachochytrium dendrobatidis JAM81]|uniref:Uncharacterized protein n=1 Tax=Batrachochytrium dendrobatidis (strain JAM81 / FGSC 10211) TaxID=684364 RepID=F4P4L8_BATDJ|nr:uncharacterized protein BATDEDRAFT_89361 [Batrachochytrium dendrobatidis JAM81]EGF79616.1 hypothetical protein BATDEDRAFT_89361 [Batrachochytrium dendrobatidis JAM81]|eukprot:XP_006679616.1 hypothetical protein BATDEDRAFT_89361 [Batrachochytrium dendrobatidis JAM81]
MRLLVAILTSILLACSVIAAPPDGSRRLIPYRIDVITGNPGYVIKRYAIARQNHMQSKKAVELAVATYEDQKALITTLEESGYKPEYLKYERILLTKLEFQVIKYKKKLRWISNNLRKKAGELVEYFYGNQKPESIGYRIKCLQATPIIRDYIRDFYKGPLEAPKITSDGGSQQQGPSQSHGGGRGRGGRGRGGRGRSRSRSRSRSPRRS